MAKSDKSKEIEARKAIAKRAPALSKHPRELIADALIAYGGEPDFDEISMQLGLEPETIKDFIKSEGFVKYMERRLIQKGFDGIRLQERVNELTYMVIDEIQSRLENPKYLKKKTPAQLLSIISSLQKTARTRAQTEEIQTATYAGRPRVDNPDETIERIVKTTAGRIHLEAAIKRQREEKLKKAKVIDIEVIEDTDEE